jgi:hypothetical protein
VEPLKHEQAFKSNKQLIGKKALNSEFGSLIANKTWALVDCPRDVTPIPCKWVFKIKRSSTGQITRFKCRLVSKGLKNKSFFFNKTVRLRAQAHAREAASRSHRRPPRAST